MFDPATLEIPRTAELRDRLVAWCDLNSGSDHRAGLDRMRGQLRAAFAVLPARIEEVNTGPDRAPALRVVCRPEAPVQVLLNSHFDTVYGVDHPFQRCTLVDRDTLRGPGTIDNKGGILVLLTALAAFERTPGRQRVGWEVVLGSDEEVGSEGTEPLYTAAAARHHFGLVFEPCRENGDLVRARKGTGTFTVTCHGRAAHAGRDPAAGRNAVLALAEYLLAVARLPAEMPEVLVNVGSIRGGGAANIVPDRATAEINARISRLEDGEKLLERLRALAAPINAREGYRLEISGQFSRKPMEPGPAAEALFAAYRECGRALGLEFDWQSVGGGSDANLLSAAGLPCLDGLGPRGGEMHSDREWVHLPSLGERARLAALFLARLAAGELDLPASLLARDRIPA
jgi:glutamate carboxypeptidase